MSEGLLRPRRALLSVSDKRGLLELARALTARGVKLVSTGGTAAALRAGGLAVEDVSAVTGHPEIMGGRVKTLHPRVHGGLLARIPGDEADLAAHGIGLFDLLVVNLYPFEEAARKGLDLPALVEEIDVGGPAMLRAAAKSYARLAVLSDPDQYAPFLEELAARGGVSPGTLARLGVAAFARTAAYDAAIQAELGRRLGVGEPLPARLVVGAERVGGPLRYGENPHQRGALYATAPRQGLGALRLLAEGRELSFNNLLDLDAALSLVQALPPPAACVMKHAGPCGAASAGSLAAAIEAAWEGDPLSAFGGVVGTNVLLDAAAARALCEKPFLEAVVAPAFAPEAVALLTARKGWGGTVRLVEASPSSGGDELELRSVQGGLLVQDRDLGGAPARWEVVTRRAPSDEEEAALRFAWACVRAVRSNAIVLARGRALVGVGGGLPSRVDAVEHATRKAGERARGAALASDGFFPFPDGVEAAHAAGVTALVQPGGSKKDPEVVARADALGLTMVLTGTRHFRH